MRHKLQYNFIFDLLHSTVGKTRSQKNLQKTVGKFFNAIIINLVNLITKLFNAKSTWNYGKLAKALILFTFAKKY